MRNASKRLPAIFRSVIIAFTLALVAVWFGGCRVCAENEASLEIAACANHLFVEGAKARAETECRRALDACPGSRTANHLMGRILVEDGRARDALACFKRAGRVSSDTSNLTEPEIIAIAESLLVLGRADTAIDFLEKADTALAANSRTSLLYAIACFKHKDFPAAVAAFERYSGEGGLLAEDRNVAWEIYSRYLAAVVAKKDEGEAILNRAAFAAKLFPDSALIHAYYGRILCDAGRIEQALAEAQKALAIESYHVEVVSAARYVLVCAGRYAEALKVWRRAIPRAIIFSPNNTLIDRVKSLDVLSMQTARADSDTLLSLAHGYRQMGWVDEATVVCDRALRLDPSALQIAAEIAELRGHNDFVERLQKYFDEQYQLQLHNNGYDEIDDIIAEMRRLASKAGIILPEGEDDSYHVVFYGHEIQGANSARSALARYFLGFGRYLHISQIHGAPFCKIMNIVAWFNMKRDADSPLLPPSMSALPRAVQQDHDLVICDEGSVVSFGGFLANTSRIAGYASLSRIACYVDISALRPTGRSVKKIVAILRAEEKTDKNRAAFYRQALMIDDLPDDDAAASEEVFQRLLSIQIDAIATHEEGHLVDMERHLPFIAHVPAHLLDGLRTGLSPRKILYRIEFYAEAFAAANAANPHMVLLRNLRLLENVGRKSPYEFYLIYYLSLERDKISPYTNAAEEMLSFLGSHLKYDSGCTDSALAGLEPRRLRKACAELCARRHVGW